jgi:hypothetical protein
VLVTAITMVGVPIIPFSSQDIRGLGGPTFRSHGKSLNGPQVSEIRRENEIMDAAQGFKKITIPVCRYTDDTDRQRVVSWSHLVQGARKR